MLNRDPICLIDDILDFVSESEKDNYFIDCERVASDRSGKISIEFDILRNCCELIVSNYCYDKKKVSLIDVGCGEGHVINNLTCCDERVALDYSLSRLKSVASGVTKLRANAEDVPVESNYFDIAICTDVFEHVLNADRLSYELYRIIKPGGLLLFSTPWKQDISIYETDTFREKFKLYECRHRRSVDDAMIAAHFVGFEIIGRTLIKAQMKFMELDPYPIIFVHFRKKQGQDNEG